jgi:serine palmitoyltransferase
MITRLRSRPIMANIGPKDSSWVLQPALKVCVTSGLSRKEIEKAGTTVRHAITKVMTRKTNSKLAVPASA